MRAKRRARAAGATVADAPAPERHVSLQGEGSEVGEQSQLRVRVQRAGSAVPDSQRGAAGESLHHRRIQV